MKSKPIIGISSCLLGENVRYDGESKLDKCLVEEMGSHFKLLSICPEMESGMAVPREPMDLFCVNGVNRMITLESHTDVTVFVTRWIEDRLVELSRVPLCGFVFKAKSPSCALYSTKVHSGSEFRTDGRGLFAQAFVEKFPLLPVEEDGRLQNAYLKKDFLDRVFKVYRGRIDNPHI